MFYEISLCALSVADPGGGVQGVRTPPPLGHDVGFLTLGPKLDPPFCECPRVGVFFNFSEGG